MIVYEYPDELGRDQRVIRTREEAIAEQKASLVELNKKRVSPFTYQNDDDALADYMTTHWAWEEDYGGEES